MAFTPDQKDNSVGWFNPSQLRREFFKQVPHKPTRPQRVSSVFKEPIYRVLEKKKIKDKPNFKWPKKMEGGPTKRNQNLYCQYHQNLGHTIEDCRTLQVFLKQLVKAGKLRQFLH